MTSRPDLDEVRRELIELAERLEALAPGAFTARVDVRERQAELREIVRRYAIAGDLLSADQIRRQIDLLKARITAHYGLRLSSRSGPSTGYGGGIEPRALHEMNRRMDAAADIDGMKRKLRQLEDRLAAFELSEGSDRTPDGPQS